MANVCLKDACLIFAWKQSNSFYAEFQTPATVPLAWSGILGNLLILFPDDTVHSLDLNTENESVHGSSSPVCFPIPIPFIWRALAPTHSVAELSVSWSYGQGMFFHCSSVYVFGAGTEIRLELAML